MDIEPDFLKLFFKEMVTARNGYQYHATLNKETWNAVHSTYRVVGVFILLCKEVKEPA
jgi:hypothetical protein